MLRAASSRGAVYLLLPLLDHNVVFAFGCVSAELFRRIAKLLKSAFQFLVPLLAIMRTPSCDYAYPFLRLCVPLGRVVKP